MPPIMAIISVQPMAAARKAAPAVPVAMSTTVITRIGGRPSEPVAR